MAGRLPGVSLPLKKPARRPSDSAPVGRQFSRADLAALRTARRSFSDSLDLFLSFRESSGGPGRNAAGSKTRGLLLGEGIFRTATEDLLHSVKVPDPE